MTTRAAIFDLDGTLLDTLDDLRASLESALKENGLKGAFEAGEFRRMVGDGISVLIVRGLPPELKDDREAAARVRASFTRFYRDNLCAATLPYPGVTELLSRLVGLGFRLGVWTNKDEDFSAALVERFFPGQVASVMGAKAGRPLKPAPEAGLELAAILGADPGDVWYVGDSEVDMEAAKGCGFIPVGAAWGFRSAEALRQAGARMILGVPSDLTGLLGATDVRG